MAESGKLVPELSARYDAVFGGMLKATCYPGHKRGMTVCIWHQDNAAMHIMNTQSCIKHMSL